MKKNYLLNFSLLAIVFAALLSFSSCTSEDKNSEKQGENEGNNKVVEENVNEDEKENNNVPKTRTIVDGLGREVEIPTKVERIIAHGDAPRILTYLELADKIVGIPKCCKYEELSTPIKAYSYVNKDLWKDLPNVGNNSYGAREWYPEEMLTCDADVIICTYNKELSDEIQEKTGIPVIAYPNTKLFSETYNESLIMLGEACGKKERAEFLVKYIKDTLADLNNRTKDYPDDKKPSALAAAATYKGKHSVDWVYANYPVFNALSVNDSAKGIAEKTTGFQVDKETVLAWNPDIMFLDASNIKLVKEDYEQNPDYFKQLNAIINGETYQWPNSTWHYSNVEIPLVTGYFVGNVLYPEEFKDIVFEDKANEIFKTFLGVDNYITILNEAGCGYKKITIE